jgi:hypothetical protein
MRKEETTRQQLIGKRNDNLASFYVNLDRSLSSVFGGDIQGL